MSIKEAHRLSLIEQIASKKLTIKQASEELGLSPRQMKRLHKRYKMQGALGLISKRRGKPSRNRIDSSIRLRAIELLKDPQCIDWGPTFAKEKLGKMHGICLSAETIRKWMIEEGLWKSRKKKDSRIYQRRARRSRFGELIQGDGSHHHWFEDRGEKCALLIFVDDATSQITAGRFFPTETTEGYLQVLDQHLKRYGRPGALYVDKHSVFRVTAKEVQSGSAETHFGGVLRALDIKLICAHSPQAKGRVERANGTLQDRLVKEMRLKGIKTIEEANVFFEEFRTIYNGHFGKQSEEKEDGHRELRSKDDLERIFARKQKRTLSKDLTFQYEGTYYQIQTTSPNRIRKTEVEVLFRPGKAVVVEIGGKEYEYKKWKDNAYQKPPIKDAKEMEEGWKKRRGVIKVKKHHPWQRT